MLDFEKLGADALLLANGSCQDANVPYFTGLWGFDYVAFVAGPGFEVLFVSEMELERARRASKVRDIRVTRDILADVLSELSQRKVRSLAVNKRFLSLSLAEKLKFDLVDCSDHLLSLRSVKSKKEVSSIKKAAATAKKAFASLSFSGTEKDISASFDFAVNKSASVPFPTIVAGDSHSSMPHYSPGTYSPKSLVLVDFGARVGNYCSDITRMRYLKNNPEFERIHSLVQEAQHIGESIAAPGVNAKDVDAAVRSFFESRGLGNNFLHSTGHGIGLEMHESPMVTPSSKDVLKEGMVFTIEPGLYFRRFGCRIEDDFIVTRSGCRRLT